MGARGETAGGRLEQAKGRKRDLKLLCERARAFLMNHFMYMPLVEGLLCIEML